jgi:hypothetical protein
MLMLVSSLFEYRHRSMLIDHSSTDSQPGCIAEQTPNTLAPYVALMSKTGSMHRFTVLVYRQGIHYSQPPFSFHTPNSRERFDLKGYVERAGLVGPIGGVFF